MGLTFFLWLAAAWLVCLVCANGLGLNKGAIFPTPVAREAARPKPTRNDAARAPSQRIRSCVFRGGQPYARTYRLPLPACPTTTFRLCLTGYAAGPPDKAGSTPVEADTIGAFPLDVSGRDGNAERCPMPSDGIPAPQGGRCARAALRPTAMPPTSESP